MQIACSSCGCAEAQFSGLRLVPDPDELTRLLMRADRVTDADFALLVRKISEAIEGRRVWEQLQAEARAIAGSTIRSLAQA